MQKKICRLLYRSTHGTNTYTNTKVARHLVSSFITTPSFVSVKGVSIRTSDGHIIDCEVKLTIRHDNFKSLDLIGHPIKLVHDYSSAQMNHTIRRHELMYILANRYCITEDIKKILCNFNHSYGMTIQSIDIVRMTVTRD